MISVSASILESSPRSLFFLLQFSNLFMKNLNSLFALFSGQFNEFPEVKDLK